MVPIVIDGMQRVYRGLRVTAFPGQLSIRVLEPIAPATVDNDALRLREDVSNRMKKALVEMREQPGAQS